jgi:hypothetical protein
MNSGGKWLVNSMQKLKTDWTWDEWRQSRAARRAVAERIGPVVVRRKASSSDSKLRDAFQGQRGPDFTRERERSPL